MLANVLLVILVVVAMAGLACLPWLVLFRSHGGVEDFARHIKSMVNGKAKWGGGW